MADNVGYTPGTGATVAADEIDGVLYQRVKSTFGVDGSAVDVSSSNPLPIDINSSITLPVNITSSTPLDLNADILESLETSRQLLQSLVRSIGQAQPDTAARLRVVVDSITGALTLATVTTVTTVATLTNQGQVGGFSANDQIPSLMRLAADSLRRNIQVS